MNRYSYLLLLALLFAFQSLRSAELQSPSVAEARIVKPVIVVAPDKGDWTYALGEPVVFTISVLADGQLLKGAEVSYKVGLERLEGAETQMTLPEGMTRIEVDGLSEPGFLRCSVSTSWDGQQYSSLATAAFEPEKILPTQSEPEDFDAFWEKQLALLDSIPLELTKRFLPDRSSETVNAYEISYESMGGGRPSRFYGILTEPKAPGKYPAVLRVPGAGVRPYSGDVDLAEKGVIVLEIGIHGIPVTLSEELYTSLRRGALHQYQTANLNDRESYYYRRVYLGCVQANSVLTQHEYWDGETLLAVGGSQGGQLSIVTAALDKRVTGNVSNYPAYCDVTGYLHGRAGGWPHMFQDPKFNEAQFTETSSYYDVVNFSRRLQVPGSYGWGYNDVTCPPTSMFAAYNLITAPKELHVHLEMGHRPGDEFRRRTDERIEKMLELD